MKNLFCLLVILIFAVSCKKIEQVEDGIDLYEVKELALTIEYSFKKASSNSIRNLFSPALFAYRLGADFKKRPSFERQELYGIFNMLYKQNIDSYIREFGKDNLNLTLFDIHKKDGVYRLNYFIHKNDDSESINYLVFYVQKDREKQMRIVNIYNVFKGFSLSQTIAEYRDINENDRRALTRMQKAANYRYQADDQASRGNYREAYDISKNIPTEFLNTSSFAYLKVSYASHISDSLFVEELKWIRALTSNDPSKKLYDCSIDYLESQNDEDSLECMEELNEILIDN